MYVCVFFSLSLLQPTHHPTTHTRPPTHWPLPLSAGWLPRLQCRLSSSCCYETRTDRPELNENASGSGKRPTTTNKRRSRQTLPNLGPGDLEGDCLVWQEPPQPYEEQFFFSLNHQYQWENVYIIVCWMTKSSFMKIDRIILVLQGGKKITLQYSRN